MEAALKKEVLEKLEGLPKSKIRQVLDFIDFLKMKNRQARTTEATDKEVLMAIENSGSLDFYYDDTQDVYTLEDGEPL